MVPNLRNLPQPAISQIATKLHFMLALLIEFGQPSPNTHSFRYLRHTLSKRTVEEL